MNKYEEEGKLYKSIVLTSRNVGEKAAVSFSTTELYTRPLEVLILRNDGKNISIYVNVFGRILRTQGRILLVTFWVQLYSVQVAL